MQVSKIMNYFFTAGGSIASVKVGEIVTENNQHRLKYLQKENVSTFWPSKFLV